MTSAFALVALLCGCGADAVRRDVEVHVQRGEYELALKELTSGLNRYPEDVPLRAFARKTRDETLSRLLESAAKARAAGRDGDAEAALKRAASIDASNERIQSLLLDLQRDSRQRLALTEAVDWVSKGQQERALRVVESALKDNPRNPDLLALQRTIELEIRQQEEPIGPRLAESRPVSLEFREANLKMVLEALSNNTGVNFILDKDIRQDQRVTVFLRQTRLEDAIELITATNQLAKKVIDARSVLIYPNTPDKQREYQDLVIKAFYLANADAKATAAFLKTMLKIREPYVDEKLNMVAIRETPETIRLAERMVALQDVSEPEVLLEVEVLEINTTRLTELGIKIPNSFSLTPLPPAGAGGLTLGNVRGLNSDRVGLAISGVLFNLRRETGDVNILANPRIRTKNKGKANILIGDKIPVITTTSNSTGFVSDSIQYLDVGLKLEVEPTIYLDDEVAIRVGLEVSSLGTSVKTASGTLAYQIGTRTANTSLKLRDGETQLLAGLINNSERNTSSRVPGLGDLPIAGRLFSSTLDDNQRTEIVLSITPHVLRNVRLPDANQTEIWSGSENNLRSRPLTLRGPEMPPLVRVEPEAKKLPTEVVPAEVARATVDERPAPAEIPGIMMTLLAPKEVKMGETFEIAFAVKTRVPLRGLPTQLQFDGRLLQVVDVTEGAFLRQGNVATSFSKTIEQESGFASFGVLRNVAEGVVGEGKLFLLNVKAIAAGTIAVRVLSATPIVTGGSTDRVELPAPLSIVVK